LKRKIAIITSSRADYAHLRWLLHDLARHPAVELQVIALGPHLSPEFGHTGGQLAVLGSPHPLKGTKGGAAHFT